MRYDAEILWRRVDSLLGKTNWWDGRFTKQMNMPLRFTAKKYCFDPLESRVKGRRCLWWRWHAFDQWYQSLDENDF